MANKTKITKTKKTCKLCKNELVGRLGKVFCSIGCKNEYHVKLRRVNKLATNNVDLILHRNRSILLEVMGKNSRQKKISRLILDKKKFNYSYVTSYHLNVHNKMVNHVYDFSWIIFSDEEILIFRKKDKN